MWLIKSQLIYKIAISFVVLSTLWHKWASIYIFKLFIYMEYRIVHRFNPSSVTEKKKKFSGFCPVKLHLTRFPFLPSAPFFFSFFSHWGRFLVIFGFVLLHLKGAQVIGNAQNWSQKELLCCYLKCFHFFLF